MVFSVTVLRSSYAHGEEFDNKETAMYFAKGYVGIEGVYKVIVAKGEDEVFQWTQSA